MGIEIVCNRHYGQIILSKLLSARASEADRIVNTVQLGIWHVSLLTLAYFFPDGLQV